MINKILALKYRPQEFKDLIGQEIMAQTITNAIKLKETSFQLDEMHYFYPASTAKLPVAILALQKLRTLQSQGIQIDADTPFLIKNKNGDPIIEKDTTHNEGKVTVHHLIKKIFLS